MSIREAVNARELDTVIDIERNYPARSATGANIDNWRTLVRFCPAKVDGVRVRTPEPDADGGIRSLVDYEVRIRGDVFTRFSVSVLDRINWQGSIMDIKDIPNQGLRGRLIGMICKAGLNRG